MDVTKQIDTLQTVSKVRMVGVHPWVQERTLKLIEVAAYSSLFFGAFVGGRSWDHQAALYAQGRNNISTVNQLRAKASLPSILYSENKIVTKSPAGSSWHNYFLAVDLVEDGDPEQAGIQWSWSRNTDYLRLGDFAKKVGLEWGGWWKAFKDYPHVQLTAGIQISEAWELYSKYGDYRKVWDLVEQRLQAKAA